MIDTDKLMEVARVLRRTNILINQEAANGIEQLIELAQQLRKQIDEQTNIIHARGPDIQPVELDRRPIPLEVNEADVEKVARTIHLIDEPAGKRLSVGWDGLLDLSRVRYMDFARAAIEAVTALRQP